MSAERRPDLLVEQGSRRPPAANSLGGTVEGHRPGGRLPLGGMKARCKLPSPGHLPVEPFRPLLEPLEPLEHPESSPRLPLEPLADLPSTGVIALVSGIGLTCVHGGRCAPPTQVGLDGMMASLDTLFSSERRSASARKREADTVRAAHAEAWADAKRKL